MMNGLFKVNIFYVVNGLHVIVLQCNHGNLSNLWFHLEIFLFFSQPSLLLFDTLCHLLSILLGDIVRSIGYGLEWKGQWLFVVVNVEHYVLQSKECFHINFRRVLIKYRSI